MRLVASCLYALRPVKAGRYSFIRKPRGRRYSSAYIQLIRRSASPPLPSFFTLLISRIQFYTRPIWQGVAAGGERRSVSNGDWNRVTDYSAFFTTNPQYAGKSIYREKRISWIYAPNETNLFANFHFWYHCYIIIASVTKAYNNSCTKSKIFNSFSRFYHRHSF